MMFDMTGPEEMGIGHADKTVNPKKDFIKAV